jgi:PAS domain S-box-containing protein
MAPEHAQAASQLAELERRLADLRQSALLPAADLGGLLEAAFTELDGAITMLGTAVIGRDDEAAGRSASAGGAERRLLRAAFTDAPVALFLLALDGTVLRVNKSAGQLLGAKPGYATGRMFNAFVALPGRAAVQTQLGAVARNGKPRRVRCGLLGSRGEVAGELIIGLVRVSGDADQLVVAVAEGGAGADADDRHLVPVNAEDLADENAGGGSPDPVAAITQRMDMMTAVTRLLLENEHFSESMTLQRCARLLAGELASWVIVDMDRRQRLRRQFVIGPDKPEFAAISGDVGRLNPPPGSLPQIVHESGQAIMIAHAEDAELLGPGPGDIPLLMLLGATSVLAVPLANGTDHYGVLTLARQAGERHFDIADLGLVEELGEQLALAIRVDHMFRRRSEIADVLQASLLPRHLPQIDGVELAATYVNATEDIDVGADFYDVYRIPGGWGLSAGDVCGRGEEAAAVTAVARHAIRVIAHGAAEPTAVLAGANEILLDEELSGGFVTAGVAHLRWHDGLLQVQTGSAGHPGVAVVRADGQVQLTGGGGVPLGLFADAEPATAEMTLTAGDVLFIYTDGVTQARGRDRAFFADRLADELSRLAGRHPDQVVSAMRTALLDFSDRKLTDDCSMVALRVGEAPAKRPSNRRRSGQ